MIEELIEELVEEREEEEDQPEFIKHRHDKFFRGSLAIEEIRRGFVERFAPAKIREMVDLNTLNLEEGTFISPELQKTCCDALLSVKIKGVDTLLYFLIEHQSKLDRLMPLRMLKYQISICERYEREGKFPLVVPIVLYAGERHNYTAPTNMWQLFEYPDLAKELWTGDYTLINVHDLSDEELLEDTLSGIMLFMLKHISDENLTEKMRVLADPVSKLIKKAKEPATKAVLLSWHYFLTEADKNDKIEAEKIFKLFLKESEVFMGSLAEEYYKEGRAEGIQKGRAEGIQKGRAEGIERGIQKGAGLIAEKMLRKGRPESEIIEFTGISKKRLLQLSLKKKRDD